MRDLQRTLFFFFAIVCVSDLYAGQLFHRKINQWKNNKYDGLWISWSDSLKKNIESKGHYRDGHETGIWRYYYDDGTPRKIERYSKRGISTKYYYPNGKIKSKGKAILDYEENLLHYFYQGKWIYYSEDGRPEQFIVYDRGKEIAHKKAGIPKSH